MATADSYCRLWMTEQSPMCFHLALVQRGRETPGLSVEYTVPLYRSCLPGLHFVFQVHLFWVPPCDQLGQVNDCGVQFIYLVREGLHIDLWGHLEQARLFTNLQPACSLLRHGWGSLNWTVTCDVKKVSSLSLLNVLANKQSERYHPSHSYIPSIVRRTSNLT